MRELIYLSERKLAQFHEDAKPRRWLPQVSRWSAKAPMGLGELEVSLADQATPQRPNLERVLRHLDSLIPQPVPYFEAGPDAGQWVRFRTRLNYQIVRPVTDSIDGDIVDEPVGPPAVIFWEPHSRWEPWDNPTPRLVLHGSPEHLVGVPSAERTTAEGLSVSRSFPPGFMDLLYGNMPRNGEQPGGALANLLHQLDQVMPPQAAGLLTGYAKVTFALEVPFDVGGRRAMTAAIVASPLYVESARDVERLTGPPSRWWRRRAATNETGASG
ncbi:SAVMC3_10250 family protein [Kitasatospora sp. YST-16]|uniref:SAVMC3_10250 family protein n=1 Tax=Kitasatospora sp. YST-16 TaxID=2998080 RepID=UPI002284DABF|nr:SAVMC3_10250 family protein [Kitasatospora sp. YST-16]WAL75857.1 SAVMC3_10250 family protein [Kitasatospora sp. YST-16]WNW41918.1 SAVMC3_10250 family protein [Streptomyces sp. Li-HN-5-13]